MFVDIQTRVKNMATTVVSQSLQKAEEGDIYEIAWLASKSAEKWLDCLNIEQSSMLAKTDWMKWAAAVVEQPEIIRGNYNNNHVAVIQESLRYMEDLLYGRR
jgi:hypothetical protein